MMTREQLLAMSMPQILAAIGEITGKVPGRPSNKGKAIEMYDRAASFKTASTKSDAEEKNCLKILTIGLTAFPSEPARNTPLPMHVPPSITTDGVGPHPAPTVTTLVIGPDSPGFVATDEAPLPEPPKAPVTESPAPKKTITTPAGLVLSRGRGGSHKNLFTKRFELLYDPKNPEFSKQKANMFKFDRMGRVVLDVWLKHGKKVMTGEELHAMLEERREEYFPKCRRQMIEVFQDFMSYYPCTAAHIDWPHEGVALATRIQEEEV
jgi:hypothetical protein